jgi:hypothetical protein
MHDMRDFENQARRNIRSRVRHAAPRWVTTLVALACGIGPMLLLFPMGKWNLAPHLAFLSFTPLAPDAGVPIAAILATKFSRRWAPFGQRRYPLIIATLTAAILRVTLYMATAGFAGQLLQWEVGHLIDTALVTWAVIYATWIVGGWPPSHAKSRPLPLSIPDSEDRDHPPGVSATDCKQSSMSRKRWFDPGSGEAA